MKGEYRMAKILLIHGAWHNGNCWKEVQVLLKKKGYESEALTLPGNGPNDKKDVTYEDFVAHVTERVESQQGPVIAVGHSSAGHVLQMSIPKVKEKVKKVIFNNAWLMPHDKAQFDFVPDEVKAGMKAQAEASGDNAIPIDAGFVKHMLATEASEDRFNALMKMLVNQPLVIMETKINANDFNALNIPKVLLHCTKDVSLPPGTYMNMFKALGNNPIVEIDCDHEGLFTNPKVFAEGLIRCIEM